MFRIFAAAIVLFTAPFVAHAAVYIGDYTTFEFNPSQNKKFVIPVVIDEPGTIEVTLFSSDGDLVRKLSDDEKHEAGRHDVLWDGRDDNGKLVPDEAYIPVVTLTGTDGENSTVDPRTDSGGEELTLQPDLSVRGQIQFNLDAPSRVLVRAGVKSGPMLKSLLNWQVRGAGRNVIRWNGFDHDGLENLYDRDDLAVLVTGFQLPKHAILTHGNEQIDYITWRRQNNYKSAATDWNAVSLERHGRRVSRHYYLSRSVDIDPRIQVSVVEDLPRNQEGNPVVTGPISLKVEMNKEDIWAMQQSLYEVAFFVDYAFLSEEEQGYVPLTWRWNPVGLTPGLHVVTVNVSAFNGQVGVSSLVIEIPNPSSSTQQQ